MARSVPETGIPNVVTSTLASYRAFDTLGETVVVFTAGIGVLVLLKRSRRGESRKS
jgi:multicomponent Na+:H+ antiporter subunit B